MAEVNDVFDKITDEKSYFDPSKKKKFDTQQWTPIVQGEYLGHITSVETKIVDVKKDGNYTARLYRYEVTVAPENKEQTYRTLDISGEMNEYTGECYQNLKFRGSLWRFLEPQEKDDFESNSGGNNNFMKFCEVIGTECPTHKKVVDGQEIEVKALPNLTTSDMLGKPVTAVVAKGRPFKNKAGETKSYFDCKFVKVWEDGVEKVITNGDSDAIPF